MEVPQLKPVQDVPDIDLDDIDKLLESLSPEELEELNGDFDPDVSLRFVDLFMYPWCEIMLHWFVHKHLGSVQIFPMPKNNWITKMDFKTIEPLFLFQEFPAAPKSANEEPDE